MSEASAKSRDISFDAFRGIAIFMVVWAHAGVYGWDFRDRPDGWFDFHWSLWLRNLALPTLPVFLFISGYWLANVQVESRAEYAAYLRKRVSKIAVPYLVWSLFFIGIAMLGEMRRGEWHLDLPGILWKLLTGQADGPYFFIVLILQFYLITPWCVRWSRSWATLRTVIIVHAAAIGVLYLIRAFLWEGMPYTYAKLPFPVWLTFFPLGMYFRRNPGTEEKYSAPGVAMLTLLLYAFSMLECYYLLGVTDFEFAINDIRYTALFFGTGVVLCMLKIRAWPWPRALATLGEYTFGIFFIHGFILRQCGKRLMAQFPGLYEIQPLFQILLAVLVLAICCVIIGATRKILGRERAGSYLGF